jgi:type IV fimbrial biogenesis protein FimT
MRIEQQKITGFTLIELIITLAVAAILLGLAAPSFTDMIKDNRLIAQTNEFTASLNLGRSEAIKRALTVTICKSDNQTSCGGNWQGGWLVFEDVDGQGDLDSGTDTIIRVHAALSNGNTLVSNSSTTSNRITYDASGFAMNYNSTFTFCDDRGLSSAKGRVISPSGRIRVASASDLTSCS